MGIVYEALLLFGPLLVIGFVYSVIVDFSDKANPDLHDIKRTGLQIIIVAALLVYFSWGWSQGRCTLPIQTLGMRLQLRNGRDVDLRTAIVRALIAIPSTLSGIGWLWAIVDRDSQTIHDRLAGTRLVYVPVGRVI